MKFLFIYCILLIIWIEKHLVGTQNPSIKRQGITRKFRRCLTGEYRLITHINDEKSIILLLAVGYRKDIFYWKEKI